MKKPADPLDRLFEWAREGRPSSDESPATWEAPAYEKESADWGLRQRVLADVRAGTAGVPRPAWGLSLPIWAPVSSALVIMAFSILINRQVLESHWSPQVTVERQLAKAFFPAQP